jgi:hypothetical protein
MNTFLCGLGRSGWQTLVGCQSTAHANNAQLESDWTLSATYPTSTQVAAPPEMRGRVEGGKSASSRGGGRPHRQSEKWFESIHWISQKSRTGDDEQTPVANAGLPEGQLYAEANHIVGGHQALEPGREFAALDWVAEP